MEKIITGDCGDTSKEKMNLYSLRRKLLVNKYYNKKSDVGVDFLKQLKLAVTNLKSIEDIECNSDIEFNIYKQTSTPMFLWQEKIVNEYKLFVTIIGFIDGLIDNIHRRIVFEENFNNFSEINQLIKQKTPLLEKRKKVLEDYNNINKRKLPNFIDKILEECPSYKGFNECYEDIVKNNYQLDLQIEFINAYNFGYTKEGRVNFNYIFEEYMKLYEELVQFKNKKRDKVKKIKR